MKFVDFLKNKRGVKATGLLVHNLSQSEVAIVGYVQHEHYSSELQCLVCGESVPRSSCIKGFSPVLDDNGLIRVGGRLSNALVSDDVKRPYSLL